MIKKLIRLANQLDTKGFAKEADYLDKIIATAEQDDDFKALDGHIRRDFETDRERTREELRKVIKAIKFNKSEPRPNDPRWYADMNELLTRRVGLIYAIERPNMPSFEAGVNTGPYTADSRLRRIVGPLENDDY